MNRNKKDEEPWFGVYPFVIDSRTRETIFVPQIWNFTWVVEVLYLKQKKTVNVDLTREIRRMSYVRVK